MRALGQVRRITLVVALMAPLILLLNNCGSSFQERQYDSSTVYTPDCTALGFTVTRPASIDEVTNLINQLPKPLSLECFLYYLPRPLSVHAATSNFSAQTSDSPENPRIFIVNPVSQTFLMSVIPTGSGKLLLEMSQYQSATTSVKAELSFPITGTIAVATPYNQILSGMSGTSCKTCHNNEASASGSFGGTAFVSDVLRPDPARRVSLSEMNRKAKACDRTADSYRCGILNSVFGNTSTKEVLFP